MGLLARNSKAPIVLLILPKWTWDNDDFSHNKDTAASIRSKILATIKLLYNSRVNIVFTIHHSICCVYQTTQTWQENRDLMAMNDSAIQKRPFDFIIWAKPTLGRFIFGAL